MTPKFSNIHSLIQSNSNPIFSSPSFQAYVKANEEEYDNCTDDKVQYYIFGKTFCAVNTTIQLYKVWKEIPVDFFHNYIIFMEGFILLDRFNDKNIASWFAENMKVRSFFNMMFCALRKKEVHEVNDLFSDTIRQLSELLKRGHKDKIKIKRWRLVDFHDQISDLFIEYTTEDLPLPVESIKKPFIQGNYVVYQPDNKITLAKWASRVKNCVLLRSDSILNKHSEVILIEEGGRPYYTVEINAPEDRKKMGIQIKEIKGPCNAMVPDDKQKMCIQLIENAMSVNN